MNNINYFLFPVKRHLNGKRADWNKLKMKTLCLLFIAVLSGMIMYYSLTRQHNSCNRLWLLSYVVIIYTESGSSSDDVTLNNPSPVPLGTTAVFTCSGTGIAIVWDPANATNASVMGDSFGGNVFKTSRLSVLAIEENNNTAITCVVFRTIRENLQRTKTLTIYG